MMLYSLLPSMSIGNIKNMGIFIKLDAIHSVFVLLSPEEQTAVEDSSTEE